MPNLGFGARCGGDRPDWRKFKNDEPDDDTELAETPKSVVEMLGFDPLDDEASASDEAKFKEEEHPRKPDGVPEVLV